MKHLGSITLSFALIFGFLVAVTTGEAHAYIDPGSGSFIIQMLLAMFFASLFSIKVFWHRFTAPMSKLLSKLKRTKNAAE